MSYYAGLDISGKPLPEAKVSELLVPCITSVSDVEALNADFSDCRKSYGMPQWAEFHGHRMSPEMIAAILRLGQRRQMRVGALLMGQTLMANASSVNTVTRESAAVWLLRQFLPLYPLSKLWYDKDIEGEQRQKAFETEVQRLCPGVKVRCRDSRIINLIQLADVTAYALSWETRKTKVHPAIRQCLKELRADAQNLIIGPIPWGTKLE